MGKWYLKAHPKRRSEDLWLLYIYIYISLYIISLVLSGCDGGGRLFHPSVLSSIHPSSSSWKKKMMEEEGKNSCSLAICQKLQTNFKKLKIVEKKMRNKRRNLF
jgi:hypothetical protein